MRFFLLGLLVCLVSLQHEAGYLYRGLGLLVVFPLLSAVLADIVVRRGVALWIAVAQLAVPAATIMGAIRVIVFRRDDAGSDAGFLIISILILSHLISLTATEIYLARRSECGNP